MGSREPLYLDVLNALKSNKKLLLLLVDVMVWDLKDTNPTHIKAVYDELKKTNPKKNSQLVLMTMLLNYH